jgi:hypothetical protein
MVYRFDEEGHGEVFAEQRRPDLEPFLGNRYPASDIPQIARRLYEINRIRVLVDVVYAPVPLRPRLSPLTGRDMSLCFLRSMSPIHIQYLKNMGVAATLVASLMVGGKLWGLISCHHYSPRFLHYEPRAVGELLAETVATRITALESFAQAQAELTVRRLEQRIIQAISRDGDWRVALFDRSEPLLGSLGATGTALLFEGQILTAGEVPGSPQLREISEWLDTRPRAAVIATSGLASEAPAFANRRAGERDHGDPDAQPRRASQGGVWHPDFGQPLATLLDLTPQLAVGLVPLRRERLGITLERVAPTHHLDPGRQVLGRLDLDRQAEPVEQLRAELSFLGVAAADQDKPRRVAHAQPLALDQILARGRDVEQEVDQVILEQVGLVDVEEAAIGARHEARLERLFAAGQRPLQVEGAHDAVLSRPKWQIDHRHRHLDRLGRSRAAAQAAIDRAQRRVAHRVAMVAAAGHDPHSR